MATNYICRMAFLLPLLLILPWYTHMVTSQSSVPPPTGGAELWLFNAIMNYSEWIQENNMYPSPVVTDSIDLSQDNALINLQFQIWNYTVDQFARDIIAERLELNLIDSNIHLTFYSHNPVFTGEFVANGSFLNSIPIYARGNWSLMYRQMRHSINFDNIHVTPDGFLNVSTQPNDFDYFVREQVLEQFDFNGLLDNITDPYKEQVKDLLSDKFISARKQYTMQNVLFAYFQELFKETPLAEIIGATPGTTVNIT